MKILFWIGSNKTILDYIYIMKTNQKKLFNMKKKILVLLYFRLLFNKIKYYKKL